MNFFMLAIASCGSILDAMVHVAYEFPSDAPMATVKLVMHSFVESTGPKSAAALNAALALGPAVEAWLSDAAATAGPPADFTRVSMPQSSRRTSSGFAVMPAGRVMSMLTAPASVAVTN